MSSKLTTFTLKQNPDTDQWWPIILFLSIFVVMAIFGDDTTWLRDYVIVMLALSVALGIVLWRKAKCVLYAGSEQLVIEVTRAGYRAPVGTTSLPWQHLISYEFDEGESEDTIELRWSNGISRTFSGRDLNAFYAYLKNAFPQKERRR